MGVFVPTEFGNCMMQRSNSLVIGPSLQPIVMSESLLAIPSVLRLSVLLKMALPNMELK